MHMDTTWIKAVVKDDQIHHCCLNSDSAVHVLVHRSVETLELLRTLWSLLPPPQVPDQSNTGYWLIPVPGRGAHTKKPLRSATSARRRVPSHRAALPAGVPDKRGLDVEEFQEYKSAIRELSAYDGDRLIAFLQHGPCVYWSGLRGLPGADVQRFPGATVVSAGRPPNDLCQFAGAAIIPSYRARSYAEHVGRDGAPRPLTFVVHYATRTASLKQFLEGHHGAQCETHKKANWFVGPLVLAGAVEHDIPIDDEDEEA